MGSSSSERFCVRCDSKFCPICSSRLVELNYLGNDARCSDLMEKKGFRSFLGCMRVDLHDKALDGVDYRGKVYILGAVFDDVTRGR